MQILIVEDDFISRRLLCRYLEPLGNCDMAVNGKEALAAVRSTLESGDHYNLICLDIMMPEMDGHEVLEGVRQLEDQHDIPAEQRCRVVMTSALEKQEIIDKTKDAEADDYIVKPIVRRNFMETLERLGLTAPAD
ncbi:response regulator [bacterium]|nr:response regulator [bacterium]PIV81506.1 MAG: response regulator [bacterium CG17_big_fil_post_rev_8_21_14_2_50_64_8]PJA76724.1 MAG: response regulator [bacterium CG_4_9_14_3_um_filter_65_15]